MTKDDKMQIPEISREDDDDIDLLIEERNDFTIIGNPWKEIYLILKWVQSSKQIYLSTLSNYQLLYRWN